MHTHPTPPDFANLGKQRILNEANEEKKNTERLPRRKRLYFKGNLLKQNQKPPTTQCFEKNRTRGMIIDTKKSKPALPTPRKKEKKNLKKTQTTHKRENCKFSIRKMYDQENVRSDERRHVEASLFCCLEVLMLSETLLLVTVHKAAALG